MKNRSKRISGWLMLAAMLLPILAACGTAADSGSGAASAPADTASAPAEDTAASAEAAPSEAAASEAAASEAAPVAEGDVPQGTLSGKVLRVVQQSVPDVVDPQVSSVTNEISILSLTYEGLTKLDKELKTVPAAAESWEFNEDATQLTFKLRPDLKYSDGSPLTSANFAYSIERNCDPNVAGEYAFATYEIIGCSDWSTAALTDTAAVEAGRTKLLEEGMQTPDESTLVLNFTAPAPYYPTVASIWTFYPAKKELIEAGGDAWWKDAKNQIGNGPFQLIQYSEGQLAAFEANESYWEGRPKLDGVEFLYIKDAAVALEAYRSDQIDVIQPDSSQIPLLKEDAELKDQLLTYAAANTWAMGFNQNLEPFNDKKVREAFSYAFDRETYCNVIRNGACVPTYSWIPKGIPGAIDAGQEYAFDPEKAKQALAESSYGGPESVPEIKLTFNADDPATQPRMEWVAQQIREILGLNVTLDPQEGQTVNAARKDNATYPQWLSFATNWYQDYPDPQNWISVYWNSGSFAARIGYKSDRLDELAKQGDTTVDQEERLGYYEEAGQILIDDLPAPFVFNEANVFLVKPSVSGYTTTTADSEIPGQWGSLLTMDKTE